MVPYNLPHLGSQANRNERLGALNFIPPPSHQVPETYPLILGNHRNLASVVQARTNGKGLGNFTLSKGLGTTERLFRDNREDNSRGLGQQQKRERYACLSQIFSPKCVFSGFFSKELETVTVFHIIKLLS